MAFIQTTRKLKLQLQSGLVKSTETKKNARVPHYGADRMEISLKQSTMVGRAIRKNGRISEAISI